LDAYWLAQIRRSRLKHVTHEAGNLRFRNITLVLLATRIHSVQYVGLMVSKNHNKLYSCDQSTCPDFL
jgi:hypothetical protein